MKRCTKCSEIKPLDKFYRRRTHRGGRCSFCKDCANKSIQSWRDRNKDRVAQNLETWWSNHPHYGRDRWRALSDINRLTKHLRSRYGITAGDYYVMLNKQKFRCAICNVSVEEISKRLAVDHCHKTGQIRGLLCTNCNIGLGKFQDDPGVLEAAIGYLKRDIDNEVGF